MKTFKEFLYNNFTLEKFEMETLLLLFALKSLMCLLKVNVFALR